jgi:8-amino-7-oxononanoate synthase
MWRTLLEAGLYANIVLPPACRPDACLLRTSYSSAHTPRQIDQALAIFEQVGRALQIIDAAA